FLKGGGLVGKIRRDQRAAQQKKEAEANPQMAALAAERPVSTGGVKWSVPDFASYNNTGTIFWSVESVINFVAPASDFDAQFQSAFMTIIEKVHLHSDVESLASQFIANEAARIQGRTNVALQQQQAQFQAMQAANAQVQAAHDAQVQQWFRNSDAHHQAFRAATNAQFNSAPGSSAPDYSEAIRGVNTYRTSDGREVEISVSADRAWENQAGDVIGTSGATEPGADWTQLPLA
ncbi:MAG: hypothetical protein IJH87_00600, partial [Atopobiaceae bacterium]|nr:hypothetical protein [Atopobiaceae bacterium]